MILEEETFKTFGYRSKELSKYSHKKIVTKCDECGNIREISKGDYRGLCCFCAMKKVQYEIIQNTPKNSFPTENGILENETFVEYDYYPSQLKSSSNKKILSECIECKKIRIISKNAYHDLCQSCANKKLKHSIETKRKMSEAQVGEKNCFWRGGLSFEPYCIKFNKEFKERVRKFWCRKCVLCDKSEIENGRKLNVHHVTYNKDTCCDGSKPLFVALCNSCHNKTNSKRKNWQEEFERIIYSRSADGKCFYSKEEMNEMKEDDSDD